MSRNEIIDKLTPIAREMLKKDDLVISDDLSAANVDTWSSMSFMMLLTEIENQFGFKFKMMEILKLQNMGAIIDSIEVHLNA